MFDVIDDKPEGVDIYGPEELQVLKMFCIKRTCANWYNTDT